jgi:hypothetical protein
VKATRISDSPVPLWLITVAEPPPFRPPFNHYRFLKQIAPTLVPCQFRGVPFTRLETVLRTGIDVEPPDGVIFAEHFEKAWEYGSWPKLILALDRTTLSPTCHIVPRDTPQFQVEELQRVFPTVLRSEQEEMLWMSRLRADSGLIGTEAEASYARWIPGDPKEALQLLMIFATSDTESAVRETIGRIHAG